MTRRRVLLLGSVAIVAAMAVAMWAVWPRPSAITEENAAKIQQGMTLAEVEAILGGPARDETGGAEASLYVIMILGDEREWIAPGIAINIRFDGDNRVALVHRGATLTLDGSFLDRVCRWLHL